MPSSNPSGVLSGAGSRPNSSTAAAGRPGSNWPVPCSSTSRPSITDAADTALNMLTHIEYEKLTTTATA